mmetsp:Transcript_15839/g.44411  ORF Transcript_15839/g.44411 Transcript_15839/m.44411 type:complete len:84 (+) Transcript_15839:1640-1891(+)
MPVWLHLHSADFVVNVNDENLLQPLSAFSAPLSRPRVSVQPMVMTTMAATDVVLALWLPLQLPMLAINQSVNQSMKRINDMNE